MAITRRDFLWVVGATGIAGPLLNSPEVICLAGGAAALPEPNREIYGPLAGSSIALSDEATQKSALGLFLTMGVANQYRRGDIDKVEAKSRITAIVQSNQIPDAVSLKAISDSLGSDNSAPPIGLPSLDTSVSMLVGMAGPFVSPAGAVALGVLAKAIPPAVKYLSDPNNPFTGSFAPPQPDAIQIIGSVAASQLDRLIQNRTELAQIYKEVVPTTASHLQLGGNVNDLVSNSPLDNDVKAALLTALNGDNVRAQLDKLHDRLNVKLDNLNGKSDEILKILQKKNDQDEKAAQLESKRQEAQRIQQEVSGGIQIIDCFTRTILGDKHTADLVTGSLRTAQTGYNLFTSFLSGSIGPLGFVGGIATALTGLFGLFGGGAPDPVLTKLDDLDKKLTQIGQYLQNGFEHIDARLNDVMKLSQDILLEVERQGQINQTLIKNVEAQISSLTRTFVQNARDQIKSSLDLLITDISTHLLANDLSESNAETDLNTLVNHAIDQSRLAVMNGGDSSISPADVATGLSSSNDIRDQLGKLKYAASFAGVNVLSDNVPNLQHCARAVHSALQLIVQFPTLNLNVVKAKLSGLWDDANAVRCSILAATCQDVILSLLDRYEVLSLRGRSNPSIGKTLDEIAGDIVNQSLVGGQPIGTQLSNAVQIMAGIGSPEFFSVAPVLAYLMSVLSWRTSSNGDTTATNPRAVDILYDNDSVASYLAQRLGQNSGSVASITEQRDSKSYLATDLQKKILTDLQDKLASDIDRLRQGIPSLSASSRVRDVDEFLVPMWSLAGSRKAANGEGIALPNPTMPALRVPAQTLPKTIYEVDGRVFAAAMKALCISAGQNFADIVGDDMGDGSGWHKAKNIPMGFTGMIQPLGTSKNPDGSQTALRVSLIEPMNWSQAVDQRVRYCTFVKSIAQYMSVFKDIMLPRYVTDMDSGSTTRFAYDYVHGPFSGGGFPLEIALITRQLNDGPAARFANELWIFGVKSGGILKDVQQLEQIQALGEVQLSDGTQR